MTKYFENIVKVLEQLTKSRLDVLLFLAGFLFILLALVSGISTEGGLRIIARNPLLLPLLVLGGIMVVGAIVLNIIGRDRIPRDIMPPKEMRDFIDEKGTTNDEPVKLEPEEEWTPERIREQQRKQIERLKTRSIDHPLVVRIAEGVPSSDNIVKFEKEMRDRYQIMTPTNRKIVQYTYRQIMKREVPIDDIFESFNEWHEGDSINSKDELINRILLIASAGFFALTLVGQKRTIIRKKEDIEEALEGILS